MFPIPCPLGSQPFSILYSLHVHLIFPSPFASSLHARMDVLFLSSCHCLPFCIVSNIDMKRKGDAQNGIISFLELHCFLLYSPLHSNPVFFFSSLLFSSLLFSSFLLSSLLFCSFLLSSSSLLLPLFKGKGEEGKDEGRNKRNKMNKNRTRTTTRTGTNKSKKALC